MTGTPASRTASAFVHYSHGRRGDISVVAASAVPSPLSSLSSNTNDILSLATTSSSASLTSSNSVIAAATELATTTTTDYSSSSSSYGPIMPPPETLIGMGVIVILCIVTCWVWSNQVVPVSRTNLAMSKRSGPVKEYLDELKQSSSSSAAGGGVVELTTTTTSFPQPQESLLQMDTNTTTTNTILTTTTAPILVVEDDDGNVINGNDLSTAQTLPSSQSSTSSRALERWLFTDWLVDNKSAKPGRQKEPAIPILKTAKWNSGDNPVLVASTLIGIAVLISSSIEYISSSTTTTTVPTL